MRNTPAGQQLAGFMRQAGGGLEGVKTTSASGSALTIDARLGNVQDITLTANCTFTINSVQKGTAATLTLILRQDGTGSRTVTWPGSVTWLSGAAPYLYPSASAVSIVTLETVDGGTTWYGAQAAPIGPGYEFGYDQITANVNATGTTEGTATTVITCSAHTFDGQPVIAKFHAPGMRPSTTLGSTIVIGLFESGTLINRLAQQGNWAGSANPFTTAEGSFRFQPSAGSHSYVVAAWVSSTTGTPAVAAGAGGPGNNEPAYVRFTKV